MTSFKLPNRQKGFADLRAQLQQHLHDPAVPDAEIGSMPIEKARPIKRATLSLNKVKSKNLKNLSGGGGEN